MATLKTEGKCLYCGKIYTRQGMNRHLESHLKQLPPADRKKSFHLRIDAAPYFLNLLLDGDTELGELDHFLRAIWLECCGHLSEFSFERWGEELRLNQKARRAFDKGINLWYAYDFGSTTELGIHYVNVHPVATKEGVLLLSRNEPLEFLCDRCGKKPALKVCTVHWGEEACYFCDECGEMHSEECEDAEYAMSPVVNSPRMGVCGYTGGTIDLERDGVRV